MARLAGLVAYVSVVVFPTLLLLFLLIVCAQYFRLLNKWEEEK
mgnify:CR=1 FL=1